MTTPTKPQITRRTLLAASAAVPLCGLLTQVRNGSVEFFNQSSSILATFAPVAGIVNTGFAFENYEAVWKAMDGELGAYIRAQIAKTPITTISKVEGFTRLTLG